MFLPTKTFSLNLATAWVQFNEDFASGDVVGVAINSGGGFRIINTIPCDGQGSNGARMFGISTPAGGTVVGGSSGCFVEVYHHSSGTKTLRDANLVVFQFEPNNSSDIFANYP